MVQLPGLITSNSSHFDAPKPSFQLHSKDASIGTNSPPRGSVKQRELQSDSMRSALTSSHANANEYKMTRP